MTINQEFHLRRLQGEAKWKKVIWSSRVEPHRAVDIRLNLGYEPILTVCVRMCVNKYLKIKFNTLETRKTNSLA